MIFISVRVCVNLTAILRPEGLCQGKFSITPSRIETATFLPVAHCHNQLHYHLPLYFYEGYINLVACYNCRISVLFRNSFLMLPYLHIFLSKYNMIYSNENKTETLSFHNSARAVVWCRVSLSGFKHITWPGRVLYSLCNFFSDLWTCIMRRNYIVQKRPATFAGYFLSVVIFNIYDMLLKGVQLFTRVYWTLLTGQRAAFVRSVNRILFSLEIC